MHAPLGVEVQSKLSGMDFLQAKKILVFPCAIALALR
jgi:hypothetical protein